EADGPARDQRHADVLPVLVAGVLDQGPALQQWGAVLAVLAAEHEPIARLPQRVLDDVADLDVALAVALEIEADDLLLAIVRGGEDFQGAAQLAVDARVEEAEPLHLRQRHGAHALGT